MGLMEAFSEACQEFPAFRAAVVKARDLAADAGTRQQLDHLLQSLDQTFADVKQAVPKAMETMKQRLIAVEEDSKKVQAHVASMKATLARHEAAEAAAAASAPVPAPAVAVVTPVLATMAPLDFQGSLRLRDELLKRFGIAGPLRAPEAVDAGSVADHWENAEEPPAKVDDEWPAELRTTPAKPRPKKDVADAGPKKTPPTPADDDSIGRSEGTGDENW